jgi:agmatinase
MSNNKILGVPTVKLFGVPTVAGCRAETSKAVDQNRGPAAFRSAHQLLLAGFDIPQYFVDGGDLDFPDTIPAVLAAVEDQTVRSCQAGEIPFLIGGAHTLTLGTLRGLKRTTGEFSMIYFDAHPDMMPRADINYGSSIYHALNEGQIAGSRTAMLGVRQIERPEAEQIKKFGVNCYSPLDFARRGAKEIVAEILTKLPPPYFISLDLDAIDPIFAPGVTSPTPVGLSPLDVLSVCSEVCRHPVIALEIVELSPVNDRDDETANLTAGLVKALTEFINDGTCG